MDKSAAQNLASTSRVRAQDVMTCLFMSGVLLTFKVASLAECGPAGAGYRKRMTFGAQFGGCLCGEDGRHLTVCQLANTHS
jgi:hypothetical protein